MRESNGVYEIVPSVPFGSGRSPGFKPIGAFAIAARSYFTDYSGRRRPERPEIDWSDPRFSSREPSFAELYEAMLEDGCPICRLGLRTADHYLSVYCSENVTDVDIRARVREANGFCNVHAWRLPDQRDALGLSITFADVIKNLGRQLDAHDPESRNRRLPGWLFRLLRDWRGRLPRGRVFRKPQPCPVCVEQFRAERRYAATFADYADDEMLIERYREGDGLCLPHLKLVIASAADDAAINLIAGSEVERWRELYDLLDEIVRKADYRFNQEAITPQERDALTRVLAIVSGAKGLSDWRPDS